MFVLSDRLLPTYLVWFTVLQEVVSYPALSFITK